jgi:hypothetical protein
MGDVRIVTGILGNANFYPIRGHIAMCDFENRCFAFWQGNLHLVQMFTAP